jgi:hypothetical protein
MNKYLKEEEFYSDLYDLSTIKECLSVVEFWDKRNRSSEDIKDKLGRCALDFQLYFIKGERYRAKKSFIQERMDEGRRKDEKLERTVEPEDIYCDKCQMAMKVIFKDLYCSTLRVLFFFECPKCCKRRGVFDDGQEYVSKGAKLSMAELAEWDREDAEWKEQKKKDKHLLEEYRHKFCLSEAEGEEYILSSDRLKEMANFCKSLEQKKADPDYEKAMNLKKLTIVELEKFLKGILEKEKYIRLALDKPVIDKHVIVPLTVQDEDSSRNEYDSIHVLGRVLKKNLEGTNWRLMSQGVNYRLGFLSCQLKGYEQEADLIQIIKSRKSKG